MDSNLNSKIHELMEDWTFPELIPFFKKKLQLSSPSISEIYMNTQPDKQKELIFNAMNYASFEYYSQAIDKYYNSNYNRVSSSL